MTFFVCVYDTINGDVQYVTMDQKPTTKQQ